MCLLSSIFNFDVINFYITGTFLSPEHILTNFEQVVFELRAFLFLKNYASVKGWFDKERMKVGWLGCQNVRHLNLTSNNTLAHGHAVNSNPMLLSLFLKCSYQEPNIL